MSQATLPFETQSAASRAAAERMRPYANTMRYRVYKFIVEHPRCCDQGIAAALDMNLKTVNARRRELEECGLIRADGLTRSPKNAESGAWRATDKDYPNPFPSVKFTAARRRADKPTAEEFAVTATTMERAYRAGVPFPPEAIEVMRWLRSQSVAS